MGKRELGRIRSLARLPLLAFMETGAEEPAGLLFKHLRGLRFGEAAAAPAGAETLQGVFVVKKRRSGKSGRSGMSGCAARRRRLASGDLVAASPKHVRLKRGRHHEERRAIEIARYRAKCFSPVSRPALRSPDTGVAARRARPPT